MKVSIYNIFIENKAYKNWLLFNSRSCVLLEIDDEVRNYLNFKTEYPDRLVSPDMEVSSDTIKELLECQVLVDSNTDELNDVKRADVKAYEQIKNKENYFDFTICPTLNCNLRCTYCYEIYHSDSKNYGIMSDSVQKKIIQAYSQHCKKIEKCNGSEQRYGDNITWYGGEPLLCIDAINNVQGEINKLAQKHNREIKNSITTNGILLTSENQEILRKNKIQDIQISIDGPEKIHNKRRYFPEQPSRSFDILADNLSSIDEYFKVLIRINVDDENFSYINKLIEELIERNIWPRKNVAINIANVKCQRNGNYEYAIPHSSFAKIDRDFRLQKLKLYNKLMKGANARLKLTYPSLEKKGCFVTVNKNSNVIGPKGEVYSCWCNVGNKNYIISSIDKILQGDKFECKHSSAITPDLRQKLECYECKIFPVCSIDCQESFVRDGTVHADFLCSKWKHTLEDTILFNYDFEKKYPELVKGS